MTDPKWLEIARQDLGIKEIAGPEANPRIMAYYRAAGATWAKDDAVPWCGAAMAAWMTLAGCSTPPEPARARAWLDWGVPLEAPKKGAVVVLKRGADETKGHVTLYLEDRGDRILCLGGNQGDAVSITSYPKRDVLGYRWPAGHEVPRYDLKETLPPARPLTRSGTIWGGLASLGATAGAYADGAVKTSLEWTATLTELAPVKAAALEMGANARTLMLALGVSAGIVVISRRAKAALEGRLG